ncbi:hypothetical protein RHGRI_006938 [Rhododendron griersonianum]|uniref:RRM domain-containing protein n=1 Tax=Rhododendron griersonianum TaxID=479676 RepID=A0AAV6KVF9_9ERIC|nr:hypothetical protein RHGRI_006938 [Rhododendron griersonianum]
MAALRKIPRHIFGQLSQQSTLIPPPSLFIFRRGIASKLFVKGISFYTTEKGLLDAFSQYGQVVEGALWIL